MPKRSVPPSIEEVAFDCPHCGAYTSHTWFELYAKAFGGDQKTPRTTPATQVLENIDKAELSEKEKERFTAFFKVIQRGLVAIDSANNSQWSNGVGNAYLSLCFTCGEVAVWVNQAVLFPPVSQAPAANADLPDDVIADYEEAGRVLPISPRGAAALLRLAIQKLCKFLGGRGESIDDDIASLVKNGLSPVVQQSLDVVRVVGNEAVHPGTLDLKDDVSTATRLFDLVNIIGEQMITNPRHVRELFEKLPETKRQAIEKRDAVARASDEKPALSS